MTPAGCGSFEFAQARLAARLGLRPDAPAWSRIQSTRSLAAVLELTRASALAGWVEGIAAGDAVHSIERSLRQRWRARVHELAGWLPEAWQPALAWCEWLVDTPLLMHRARGEPWPAWVEDDVQLRWLTTASAHDHDPRLALLKSAEGNAAVVLRRWIETWIALWPESLSQPEAELLRSPLLPLLTGFVAGNASLAARQAAACASAQRAWQLERIARRQAGGPLAAFAHLGLFTLEYERLRGELVVRAAFEPALEPAAGAA